MEENIEVQDLEKEMDQTDENADEEMTKSTKTEMEDENLDVSEEEEGQKKASKSFFKKKEKKDKKDEKIDELNDRLIRLMAEFENYRKRTEKEKSQMFEVGARDIIEKILPVIDNFERGLASVAEDEKELPFVQGIEKIYKQLIDTLEATGVKPIVAVGSAFDPNLHNAVMHAEDDSFGENEVVEEFLKGYQYRDTVIRHSMVKVVN